MTGLIWSTGRRLAGEASLKIIDVTCPKIPTNKFMQPPSIQALIEGHEFYDRRNV